MKTCVGTSLETCTGIAFHPNDNGTVPTLFIYMLSFNMSFNEQVG